AAVLVGLAATSTYLSRGALVAQEVEISEFLAGNDSGITDQDGEFSDWIELHNPGPAGADLGGWFLTDDARERDKWQIPPVVLAPGRYLVIFASGKDRGDGAFPGRELHTNFRLSR